MENKQPLVNKSAAIREYLKAHPGTSATEVAKALNEQGIMVSLALVCLVRARIDLEPELIANNSPKRGRQSKGAAQGSKAEAIREAIQRLGNSANTGAIIADLEKQGIVVAAAQVASVRSRIERLGGH